MSHPTPEEFVATFSSFVNMMAANEEHKEAIRLMCSEHRTLQQGMVRFVIKFIRTMADNSTDLRNEQAVVLCRKLKHYLDTNDLGYLPTI